MDLNPIGIRGQTSGLREFLEGKERNLGDDVINVWLEARGSFERDVAFDFVGQVTDREVA